MTDEEIRTLVRQALARHLGPPAAAPAAQPAAPPAWRAHPSFGKFLITTDTEPNGPCLIEPGVRCNHCGYCQSYGH